MKETSTGITFKVFVQPKSSKNMIAGLHGDALKIKLTAPPVDGAANKMCLKYLAKYLNVPKTSLQIVSGQTSRKKTLLVRISDESAFKNERKRIKRLIESSLSA